MQRNEAYSQVVRQQLPQPEKVSAETRWQSDSFVFFLRVPGVQPQFPAWLPDMRYFSLLIRIHPNPGE